MVTTESKKFSLVFQKGKGNHRGWFILAEKLRSLGVALFSKENVDHSVEFGGSWKARNGNVLCECSKKE